MKFNEKYKKDDLENMIFNEKLSYREIGRRYGVSDAYIKKICNKLEIKLTTRSKFPDDWCPHNKGKKQKNTCYNCNELYLTTNKHSKYCSKKCEITYRTNMKYNHYLNNQKEFEKIIITCRFLKKHILKEQNNCCNICKNKNEWNGKPIVFVLDHIDGDAANNRRENIRLVCPNCDSQLDTFKSKNKNSSRKERYILNYKNKK